MSAAVRAEAVTAVVKGRLEDRLQYLEDRLLNRPVDHVWNAEPPLSAPRLRQPDTANIARPIAFRQQVSAQPGNDRRGLRFRRFDRLSVHSGRSLVAHHVQQRPGQIGFRRHLFEQPTGVGRAGGGASRLLASSLCAAESSAARMRPRARPSRPPRGCRRTLLETALDHGIAYFDTARMYCDGQAELVLGTLPSGTRDRFLLASKAGDLPADRSFGTRAHVKALTLLQRFSPAPFRSRLPKPWVLEWEFGVFDLPRFRKSVETSLRSLRTDHLDILLLHEPDGSIARRPELLEYLGDLKANGRSRNSALPGASTTPFEFSVLARNSPLSCR